MHGTKISDISNSDNSELKQAASTALEGANISTEERSNYRYYNSNTIQNTLGIPEVTQELLINVDTRSIVSLYGIKYKKKMYYTVEQVPDKLYNVEYKGDTKEDTSKGKPTFDLHATAENGNLQLNITAIQYPGYISKGTIYYGKKDEKGDIVWKIAVRNTQETEYNISVDEGGLYYVKIQDSKKNESEVKEIEVVDIVRNYSISVKGKLSYFETLGEAYEASVSNGGDNGGGTITVLQDVEDASVLYVNKTITLNTNGKNIQLTGAPIQFGTIEEEETFTVNGGGTFIGEYIPALYNTTSKNIKVNINDISINVSHTSITLQNIKECNIKNTTIISSGYTTISSTENCEIKNSVFTSEIILAGNCTYKIEDSIFKTSERGSYAIINSTSNCEIKNSIVESVYVGILNNFGTLNIGNGTKITGSTYGIFNDSRATLTIGNLSDNLSVEDPVISGGMYGVYNWGTMNFYNGILKGTNAGYYGDVAKIRSAHKIQTGTEEINNVTYQTSYLEQLYSLEVYCYDSVGEHVISVNSGRLKCGDTSIEGRKISYKDGYILFFNQCLEYDKEYTIEIDNEEYPFIEKGETIVRTDRTKTYYACEVWLMDENYTITRGNQTQKFGFIKQAISAAQDGDTIVMVNDFSDRSEANIDKKITLNVNGYNLIKTQNAINIQENGDLIVTGTGTITKNSDVFLNSGGVLTIDGEIIINCTGSSQGCVTMDSGITNFVSGTLIAENGYGLHPQGGTLNVTGGRIEAKYGIWSDGSDTLNYGDLNAEVNNTNPIIIASDQGICVNAGTLNYYNGIVKGINNNYTINSTGEINCRDGYFIYTDKENINDKIYKIAYLEQDNTSPEITVTTTATEYGVYPEIIKISASDDKSGISTITINGVETQVSSDSAIHSYTATYNATKNGDITVTVVDRNGNQATTTYIVQNVIEFITEWTVEAGTMVTLPTNSVPDIHVDWGDGNSEEVTEKSPTHTYANKGVYEIKISGKLTWWDCSSSTNASTNRAYITGIKQWGILETTTMRNAFYGCKNLKGTIPVPQDKTFENTGSFAQAFMYCSSLDGPIPEGMFANAKKITTTSSTFYGCTKITKVYVDSSIISDKMFYGCTSLTDITIANNVTSIGTNAFYVAANAINGTTSVTTNNDLAKNYNWAGDNRTVSFIGLSSARERIYSLWKEF